MNSNEREMAITYWELMVELCEKGHTEAVIRHAEEVPNLWNDRHQRLDYMQRYAERMLKICRRNR